MSALLYAQGFVQRLAEKMTDCKVGHWPSTNDRVRFAQASHELLVTYVRSSYSDSRSARPDSADRALELSVTAFVRSLRDSQEAYAIVERVIEALHGWRPAVLVPAPTPDDPAARRWKLLGGTAVRPVSDEFLGESEGVWTWGISFTTTRPQIALDVPDVTTPFTPTEIL